MKPKKLIRDGNWIKIINPDELERINDKDELNKLFLLKIREEMQEIINSNFQDIYEFADLLQVCKDFSELNFNVEDIKKAIANKVLIKGTFTNLTLTNLNPDNPSNSIYL
jgi:predicted house-cleaning noncanonical NTP pyrophosphatase (MazG superfamily)